MRSVIALAIRRTHIVCFEHGAPGTSQLPACFQCWGHGAAVEQGASAVPGPAFAYKRRPARLLTCALLAAGRRGTG